MAVEVAFAAAVLVGAVGLVVALLLEGREGTPEARLAAALAAGDDHEGPESPEGPEDPEDVPPPDARGPTAGRSDRPPATHAPFVRSRPTRG